MGTPDRASVSETEDAAVRHEALLDRRGFLLTGSGAAVAVGILGSGAASAEPYRGEPFSDGTYFDDGTGWID